MPRVHGPRISSKEENDDSASPVPDPDRETDKWVVGVSPTGRAYRFLEALDLAPGLGDDESAVARSTSSTAATPGMIHCASGPGLIEPIAASGTPEPARRRYRIGSARGRADTDGKCCRDVRFVSIAVIQGAAKTTKWCGAANGGCVRITDVPARLARRRFRLQSGPSQTLPAPPIR